MSSRGGVDGRKRRAIVALALSLLALVGAVATASTSERGPGGGPRSPNVLLVITDDQPWDTLPTIAGRPAMPWLESRLADPADRWVRFTNAFLNVPLCCPSRASILTGLVARHTGVEGNDDGDDLDESSTLATRLDDAGYQTAFVGKYLNGYPWDRGPYVPAGWDRFLAKRNLDVSTTYERYPFVDQGVPLVAGVGDGAYATSMLEGEATTFLQGASRGRPWFLVYAPSAPHEPWTPAPEDAGSFDDAPLAAPSLETMNDVRGKPGWVQALPAIDDVTARSLEERRRRMLESLVAVDRAVHALVDQVEARGELDRTLIILLSDNGFSFGEHRWVGKRCPYDACVRTPLVVRSPWTDAGEVATPVSNVDVAPTILDLAEVEGALVSDGRSLRPVLVDSGVDSIARDGVLIEYAGDTEVRPWRGVRTDAYSYLEHADGTIELYDLTGRLGPADPWELSNVVDDPAYADIRHALASMLEELVGDTPSAPAP